MQMDSKANRRTPWDGYLWFVTSGYMAARIEETNVNSLYANSKS